MLSDAQIVVSKTSLVIGVWSLYSLLFSRLFYAQSTEIFFNQGLENVSPNHWNEKFVIGSCIIVIIVIDFVMEKLNSSANKLQLHI